MFNHSSDGLIGMLMRLARCLLDQFGLKDTTPACQLRIREWRKSPIPVCCSPVAPDCAAAAQFNQRWSKECGQTPEEHVRTNTSPSHIIKSTFGPSGFYCATAELLNQWAKHQLFSYWTHLIHLSCYKLGHWRTWGNTVIYLTPIRIVKTTTIQSVPEWLAVPAPHSRSPIKSYLCVHTKMLSYEIRRFILKKFRLNLSVPGF